MAGRLLHKLLGCSGPRDPEIVAALAELDRLENERPELAGSIALLRDFLPMMYQESILNSAPSLTGDRVATRTAGGVPALRGESISLDVKAFRRRWLRVCTAVQKHRKDDAGKRLAEALRKGQLDATLLVVDLLSGRDQAVPARAGALGLDPALTATILRLTLFPALTQLNAALAPFRHNTSWRHGYCPTCGSWPLLGEFRGLEQLRYLRCGLCTAEWEFPRLRCPFCGADDHHVLGYLHVEGEEDRYRAATCDACRGYVKMVSTLGALSGPRLLVAELATLHLDLAALARNYIAPG